MTETAIDLSETTSALFAKEGDTQPSSAAFVFQPQQQQQFTPLDALRQKQAMMQQIDL